MTGRKEAREGGRRGGRGEASRQSRRGQGLPPEEHKALDDVVREARKAGAEKRKAALEEKKKASAADQDQAAPESSVLDAHQANQDEVPEADSTGSVPAGTECVPDLVTGLDEGESAQNDEPAQASVGGADEVEPPAEDRVSDSPQPDDEVEILDEAPTIKHENPLSTVQEDGVLNDEAEIRSALAQSSPAATAQAPALKIEAQSSPAPSDSRGPDETKTQVSEAQAKAYVAEQVRRWEQHRERATVPLKVEYAWPEAAPDFTEWWTAALATSKYLSDRMVMASQDAAWIAELGPVRLELCLAQDVSGIVIPPSILSPRECVALIQSLLFAAGFRFHNLIPMWFQSQSSRVAPSLVRSVVEDVQHFLAFELIEWRELASGVPFKIVLGAPDVQDQTESNVGNSGSTLSQAARAPILNYHAEDNDGDLLMSDYEAGLLGREFVLRLRVAGLRRTRFISSMRP
ncbi:hypothetical protein PHYSODRAFT_259556 [Phytophthora sojae]|uniref:Uncharacterized protein n=1 Tax=Phytophthora sojae (strain P6497) TaxID=1094619 RepID=G4ZAW3_PHYSP|nr:hypothetical protein PHYSODRAFT_259556 [Phytophthora sojae]EGZ20591.1 hypothetical protein PHYSODRAFT_259556 [Phytophthora sojae]|eukprot:XP_009523308.1 hypothetical protein PHYSODRAFT_259556 [Phytophthora sojae]